MKKLLVLLSLLMLFPTTSYATTEENDIIENKEENIIEDTKIQIVKLEACVDGDTARFKTENDETIKARFLAIDTPETVHPTKGEEPFGKDASNYTCETLTNAKEIKLEYDNNSDEEDNYGRKLVWVFVDGVLLQESLISKGYAEVAYLYDDYKYTPLLEDTQVVAKVNKVGIWSIENEEVEEQEEKPTKKTEKEEKGFLDKLIDDLLGMIFDFFDELLEKILKMIEDVL